MERGLHQRKVVETKLSVTLAHSEGRCCVICSVWGLNPKVQDTRSATRTGQPNIQCPWTPTGGVVAASGENHREGTQHSRPQESGSDQTIFYLLFIFVSGFCFLVFSPFSPVCHQSLVSAASLQWKGRRVSLFCWKGKEDQWHCKDACVLERGVQSHECPWTWRLDDPYSFLFFTGRVQCTEIEVRAVTPTKQK